MACFHVDVSRETFALPNPGFKGKIDHEVPRMKGVNAMRNSKHVIQQPASISTTCHCTRFLLMKGENHLQVNYLNMGKHKNFFINYPCPKRLNLKHVISWTTKLIVYHVSYSYSDRLVGETTGGPGKYYL